MDADALIADVTMWPLRGLRERLPDDKVVRITMGELRALVDAARQHPLERFDPMTPPPLVVQAPGLPQV